MFGRLANNGYLDAMLPDPDADPDPDAAPMPDTSVEEPTVCALDHRLFRTLSGVLFRRAESDDTPVMVMMLGERSAAVPLRSLQRELGIEDDSADGRMLAMIAQSLDFVAGLQIGDRLPTEVLDGRASWAPGPTHRALAAARLRLHLAGWVRPDIGVPGPDGDTLATDPSTVRRLDEDPEMRRHIQTAMDQARQELGLAARSDLLGLLDELAEELSFIEALRDGLLNRVRSMAVRLDRVCGGVRGNLDRQDMNIQVRRLSQAALTQIASRFDEIDAQTSEVVAALRNLDSQRSFVRSSRDWLYRLSRAWEPLLQAWDDAAELPDLQALRLVDRTYRFLAPRYMAVQEWQAFVNGRPRGRPKALGAVMTW